MVDQLYSCNYSASGKFLFSSWEVYLSIPTLMLPCPEILVCRHLLDLLDSCTLRPEAALSSAIQDKYLTGWLRDQKPKVTSLSFFLSLSSHWSQASPQWHLELLSDEKHVINRSGMTYLVYDEYFASITSVILVCSCKLYSITSLKCICDVYKCIITSWFRLCFVKKK